MDCCETPGWRSLVERSHSAGGGPICLAFQAPFQGTLKKNRGGKLNCHGSNGSSRNCLGSPLLVGSVSPVLLFCWSELGGDQTKPHGRSIDLRRGGDGWQDAVWMQWLRRSAGICVCMYFAKGKRQAEGGVVWRVVGQGTSGDFRRKVKKEKKEQLRREGTRRWVRVVL